MQQSEADNQEDTPLQTKCFPRINICCTGDLQKIQLFQDTLSEKMSADTLKRSDVESALAAFGKRKHRNAQCYETHWAEMQPVTEAKWEALLDHKQNPCPRTCDALRAARNMAQQRARRCANDYWLNLCNKIQSAANTGNAGGMYDGIKTATGPTATKTAPLMSKAGEVITDLGKQLELWVEHYLELHASKNVVSVTALNALPNLTVMEELNVLPTEEELAESAKPLIAYLVGRPLGKTASP
jgi:hypothetical protein